MQASNEKAPTCDKDRHIPKKDSRISSDATAELLFLYALTDLK